ALFARAVILLAEIAEDAAQILTQLLRAGVVADVDAGEAFGKHRLIAACERPLGEIVGEAFGQKMIAAQRLKGVIEDRGFAGLGESGVHGANGIDFEVLYLREIACGCELKWL